MTKNVQNNADDVFEQFFLTAEKFASLNEHRPDILHITGAVTWSWPIPYWFMQKTSRWCKRLTDSGYSALAFAPSSLLPGCSHEHLADMVHHINPKLVVSRGFTLRGRDVTSLAMSMPDTLFLQSNHTPNSFMITEKTSSPLDWLDSLNAAKSLDNVYLSSVSKVDIDAFSDFAPKGKLLWVANPCDEKRIVSSPRTTENERFVIGMGSRTHPQKNLKSQIDAIAIVALKNVPISCRIFLGEEFEPNAREELRNYAYRLLEPLGVHVTVVNFIDQDVLKIISESELDAFLHVSFDESFGYLTWEMMASGVPTVTTDHIDILGTNTVNPTDVTSIANALLDIHENRLSQSKLAIAKSTEIAQRANNQFDLAFKNFATDWRS